MMVSFETPDCALRTITANQKTENGDERDANVEVANDKVFDVCEGTHNPFARLSIE